MMIKPSLAEDTEIVAEDASISLWFTEMSDLYNRVLDTYENGMMVTAESITNALGYTPADESSIPTAVSELTNDAGYLTEISSTDVTDALGYTPLDEGSIPTKVSDLTNDSGYITGISSTNVKDALGYTPAKSNDVPTKVSDLTNDSGYITGISSEDITSALGYTPVDANDVGDYLTNISSADIISALGYTPANGDSMPVVPTNISEFNNDAGYITEVSVEDVIDALGYIPTSGEYGNYQLINTTTLSESTGSVVLSVDSDGNAFSLDGAVVMLRNASGINGGANGYMYFYDADDNVIGGTQIFFYGGNSVTQSVVEVELRGDIAEMNSIGWVSAAPYSPVNKSLIVETRYTGRIAKIEVVGNGNDLRSGTRISLLGYAVGEQKDSGSIVSSGKYKLLKTITLSSPTNDIIVSTDSNSNAFELSGFVVLMENANRIDGGSNGYVYSYDSADNVVGQTQVFFAGGSGITNVAVEVEIKGGLVEMNSISWRNDTRYSPSNKSLMTELGNANRISKIEISGNGYSISSGTTIKVYGV